MSTAQSMTATARPEHRSPVDPSTTVVNADNEALWAELEYRNAHVGTHATALQRRFQNYAIKFVADTNAAGGYHPPTDENLKRVLGNCARPPRPVEYTSIRLYVVLWRDAEKSARAALQEKLAERAHWYEYEAPVDPNLRTLLNRRTADELRTVSASL